MVICNYYHCFVQYAKCVSDEKQVKFWSLCPQNTPFGPVKPAETVHLPKANPNNTVQCNKKKRKGKENWSRLLHNNVAGTMVYWSQKSTCQVTRSIVLALLLLVPNLMENSSLRPSLRPHQIVIFFDRKVVSPLASILKNLTCRLLCISVSTNLM